MLRNRSFLQLPSHHRFSLQHCWLGLGGDRRSSGLGLLVSWVGNGRISGGLVAEGRETDWRAKLLVPFEEGDNRQGYFAINKSG